MPKNEKAENEKAEKYKAEKGQEDGPLQTLSLATKANLADSRVSDKQVAVKRKITDITLSEKPLVPLPPDPKPDLIYPTRHSDKCHICRSCYRDLAEHVYLEAMQTPQAVRHFFARHFGADVTWESVKHHMTWHCDFSKQTQSGLAMLAVREEDIAAWIYRELDLVIVGTMNQLDRLHAVDCSRNPTQEFAKSAAIDRLNNTLLKARAERDRAGSQVYNLFDILMDIMSVLKDKESKQVVFDKVRQLREQLATKGR